MRKNRISRARFKEKIHQTTIRSIQAINSALKKICVSYLVVTFAFSLNSGTLCSQTIRAVTEIQLQSSYDPDAQAFLTATGITDATISNAINTLVISAKGHGWWSLCNAIYPMVGGTATTCAVNLKSPGTSNITWTGTPTFASTGVTPSNTNYGVANFNDNNLTYNNAHMSYYSRTNNTIINGDMGALTDAGPINALLLQIVSGSGAYYWFSNGSGWTFPLTDTRGHYLVSSASSNPTNVLYRNGSLISSHTATLTNTHEGTNFYIGRTPLGSGQRECAFATIGAGISGSIASLMYGDIQTFQIALGRQV